MPVNSLESIVEGAAPLLELTFEVDKEALLLAIADIESSGGTRNIPRFERAYSIGGYYYRKAPHVRQLFEMFGDAAAMSWSSWQIMFITAWELGYRGAPWDLRDDRKAIWFVTRYINKRAKNAASLTDVADAYNTGSFGDQIHNEEYERKIRLAYKKRVLSA